MYGSRDFQVGSFPAWCPVDGSPSLIDLTPFNSSLAISIKYLPLSSRFGFGLLVKMPFGSSNPNFRSLLSVEDDVPFDTFGENDLIMISKACHLTNVADRELLAQLGEQQENPRPAVRHNIFQTSVRSLSNQFTQERK
jgi:hypothetical protein